MNRLCVVKAGSIKKTIDNEARRNLLGYLDRHDFDKIFTITHPDAITTTRVLDRATGLPFRSDKRIGVGISSKYGWQYSQHGAANWVEAVSRDHTSGVIAVVNEISMVALAGAAMRETQGCLDATETIVRFWQTQGIVAVIAEIATGQLVEPIMELRVDLSKPLNLEEVK